MKLQTVRDTIKQTTNIDIFEQTRAQRCNRNAKRSKLLPI